MNPESCFNCEYCKHKNREIPGAFYGASSENLLFGHYNNWYCDKTGNLVYSLLSGCSVSGSISIPKWCPLGYYKPTYHSNNSCKHSNNHGICLGYSRNCNLEVGNEKYCKDYKENDVIIYNPFTYTNGIPIQFFKCNNCGVIITGAVHHQLEYCKCGNYIDQDPEYTRVAGEFTNVTENLTNEQKREIFTTTVFNSDKLDESYIKSRLGHYYYSDDLFNMRFYRKLYKNWKLNKE